MKVKNLSLIIFLAGLIVGCVESATDATGSSTSAPAIKIFSPKTNDSIRVGVTAINYSASEGTGGSGLSYFELYLNNIFYKKYTMTGTTIPTISLEFNSTYAHKTFSYYIKVYSNSGKSTKSDVQSNIYILKAIPKAPSNLLIGPNYSYINLLWTDSSSNATGYEVWRNGTLYKTLPDSNATSFTDKNISSAVDYTYKVRAYNEDGKSAFSKEISTNIISGGQWNLQAESWGPNIVHLTWVDFAVGESGFEIQRSVNSGSFVSISPLAGPNATSFDDNTVDANITYSYQIRYFTPTAKSDFSNTVTITTSWNINPPSITGSATDTVGLYITWKDNSNYQAIGTIIERSSNNISPRNYIQVGSVSYGSGKWYLSNDSIPPTEKVIGNTYYYRVRQIIDLTKNIYTAPSNEFSIQWK